MNEKNEKICSHPNLAIGLKDYFCISNSICGTLSHRLRAVFFFFPRIEWNPPVPTAPNMESKITYLYEK